MKRDVIQLVPQIVDTCVACRNWQRPGPRSVTSTRVPDVFNKEVKIDLLFYKTRIILHCVDACTTVDGLQPWELIAVKHQRI